MSKLMEDLRKAIEQGVADMTALSEKYLDGRKEIESLHTELATRVRALCMSNEYLRDALRKIADGTTDEWMPARGYLDRDEMRHIAGVALGRFMAGEASAVPDDRSQANATEVAR